MNIIKDKIYDDKNKIEVDTETLKDAQKDRDCGNEYICIERTWYKFFYPKEIKVALD